MTARPKGEGVKGFVAKVLGLSSKKGDDGGKEFKKCQKLHDVIYGRHLFES
jgi:hypothetical protein